MVDEKAKVVKEVKEEKIPDYTGVNPKKKLKVKNISDRPINLGDGLIKDGAEGLATVAELVQHEARIVEL